MGRGGGSPTYSEFYPHAAPICDSPWNRGAARSAPLLPLPHRINLTLDRAGLILEKHLSANGVAVQFSFEIPVPVGMNGDLLPVAPPGRRPAHAVPPGFGADPCIDVSVRAKFVSMPGIGGVAPGSLQASHVVPGIPEIHPGAC